MIASLAFAATLSCAPLAGVEQLWANSDVSIVVFGEQHGTNEAPALFADAVCHASVAAPLAVALEYPPFEQTKIDAYLRSDGGPAARAALVQGPIWDGPMQDGRTSEAMVGLLDRLRSLKAAGRITRVVATQPLRPGPDQNVFEEAMARAWTEAAADGRLIALVGNLHARRTPIDFDGTRIAPAASHLPPIRTLTVNIVGGGGSAWGCGADGCRAYDDGAWPAPPRGVILRRDGDGAYDAEASTGGRWTASEPARR